MENDSNNTTTTKFALNNPLNNIEQTNSNNNNNHVISESNYDITHFDYNIDHMLHSNDVDFQDNHGEIMFNGFDDDFLVDPMVLLCDEIMEDPLLEQIFSDLTSSSVQVNNNNSNNNNNNNINNNNNDDNNNNDNNQNNAVIVHNNGDDNRQKEEQIDGDQQEQEEWHNNQSSFDDFCSSCQVLRDITHINGTHTIKLELHGAIGLISHAILINNFNSNDDVAPEIQDHQMIDFSGMSYDMVKEHLQKYLVEQRQRGYNMLLEEQLSPFYEALCIGYYWLGVCPNPNCSNDLQRSTLVVEPVVQEDHGETSYKVVGESDMSHQQVVPNEAMGEPPIVNEQEPSIRTELSIQRERTKSMKIEDFAKYFDEPVKSAAKRLHLCDTVVKKKLRSFGIPRWPYRKYEEANINIEE
ncbi:hypothetical protein RND81_03G123100 [Saponaria officinalis]|uniref:RWP-RK domain-containing protein n=1 Tax=Saponaria officinalis TaxID=3572 RepID=A0AAW1M5Y7_SAPOF